MQLESDEKINQKLESDVKTSNAQSDEKKSSNLMRKKCEKLELDEKSSKVCLSRKKIISLKSDASKFTSSKLMRK